MTRTDTKWRRLKRAVLYGDSHATRITLAIAELLIALQIIAVDVRADTYPILPYCLYSVTWAVMLLLSCVGHAIFLGTTRKDLKRAETRFAFGDAIIWITLNVYVMLNEMTLITAPFIALGLASCWVFVTSGYTAYGKRSTDYGC